MPTALSAAAEELLRLIAALSTTDEMGEAADAEDTAATLDELIATARQVLAAK